MIYIYIYIYIFLFVCDTFETVLSDLHQTRGLSENLIFHHGLVVLAIPPIQGAQAKEHPGGTSSRVSVFYVFWKQAYHEQARQSD